MRNTILLLAFLSILFLSCTSNDSIEYHYRIPAELGDGISIASINDAGLDTALIFEGVKSIKSGKYNEVHAILLYKNEKLVLEEYFRGHKYQWDAPNYYGEEVEWNREMLHPMMSVTKSFTSACIGIAIEKGFIANVHESIFNYLPDHQAYRTEEKKHITIENLLTMTSGLDWNEWGAAHGTAANDIDRLYFECEDPIVCVLERPMVAVPGEKFTYNGGGMVILAEMLKNASGLTIDEFSLRYLFSPLGVDSTGWWQFDNGMIDAANTLYIQPRAMLKFGITYLNKGVWKGNRIIDERWVEKSAEIYKNNKKIKVPIEDSGKSGYGYTWWQNELPLNRGKTKMFRANGWGGQAIMVFPELDMVLVFTGGNYPTNSKLFSLVEDYILEAINVP